MISFTDIDDCVNHTCSNGGSCEDRVNSYACNCAEGFTGDYCETGKLFFNCLPFKVCYNFPWLGWWLKSCKGNFILCRSWECNVHNPLCFTHVNLRLSAFFFFYFQTLTIALTIHVRTVGPVWMVFTITHANAQQDILVVTVKRVSYFLLFKSLLFV